MRVSRALAAEHREHILDVAARLFRERGVAGIGVADLMKEAGLTHGGFYGHFASKEDLVAEACARSIAESLDVWERRAGNASGSGTSRARNALTALTGPYLSARHRDHPGDGCLMAALGADIRRQGPSVRRTVTEGVQRFADILARLVPGASKAARRKKALATYASLVGAMVLARAVDDPGLSEEILGATRSALSTLNSPRASSIQS
jgi:TetR/AcrR family transcriptional repressor of nem operon